MTRSKEVTAASVASLSIVCNPRQSTKTPLFAQSWPGSPELLKGAGEFFRAIYM